MTPWTRRKFLQTTAGATATLALPKIAFAGFEPSAHPLPAPSLGKLALTRLSFGATSQELDRFKSLPAYVEAQLHPDSINDNACDEKISSLNLTTLKKTLPQLWADHVLGADALKEKLAKEQAAATPAADLKPDTKPNTQPAPKTDPKMDPAPAKPNADQKNKMQDENHLRNQPALETEKGTWMRAVYSERQLFEVMTHFWHEHFNVFAYEGRIASVFVHYDRDVIRANAFGNFREFLESVGKSPAMLTYLDNFINQSGNPNENYARELFELHTLGAENYLGTEDRDKVAGFPTGKPVGYVDGDVYEAARAFSGWRYAQDKNGTNDGQFEYFEPWHDRFQKIVLGKALHEYQPPLKDGHDVYDLLANHPGTARHIARKLCQKFVADKPSEKLVRQIAQVFHENRREKDQIRKTLRVLFLTEDFKNSWGLKVKRPFEYVTGVLRSSKADFAAADDFLHNFERTGHRPFGWRSPDGPPLTNSKWLSANTLLERFRLTNQILFSQVPELKINVQAKPSADEALHQWHWNIFGSSNSHVQLAEIIKTMTPEKSENHLRAAVALLHMSPENQWG